MGTQLWQGLAICWGSRCTLTQQASCQTLFFRLEIGPGVQGSQNQSVVDSASVLSSLIQSEGLSMNLL